MGYNFYAAGVSFCLLPCARYCHKSIRNTCAISGSYVLSFCIILTTFAILYQPSRRSNAQLLAALMSLPPLASRFP